MKKIILLNNTAQNILGFRKHLVQFLLAHNYQVYAMATDFTAHTKEEVVSLGAIPIDYTYSSKYNLIYFLLVFLNLLYLAP